MYYFKVDLAVVKKFLYKQLFAFERNQKKKLTQSRKVMIIDFEYRVVAKRATSQLKQQYLLNHVSVVFAFFIFLK